MGQLPPPRGLVGRLQQTRPSWSGSCYGSGPNAGIAARAGRGSRDATGVLRVHGHGPSQPTSSSTASREPCHWCTRRIPRSVVMSRCKRRSTRTRHSGKTTLRNVTFSKEPTHSTDGSDFCACGCRKTGAARNAASPSRGKPAGRCITNSVGSTGDRSGTAIFGCCTRTVIGNIMPMRTVTLPGPRKRADAKA